MAVKTTSLYDQVIKTSQRYLGPAGERFMRRQIETHLSVSPEDLSKNDVPKLAEWTRLAFAMLTSDTAQVDSFMSELLSLPEDAKGSGSYAKSR